MSDGSETTIGVPLIADAEAISALREAIRGWSGVVIEVRGEKTVMIADELQSLLADEVVPHAAWRLQQIIGAVAVQTGYAPAVTVSRAFYSFGPADKLGVNICPETASLEVRAFAGHVSVEIGGFGDPDAVDRPIEFSAETAFQAAESDDDLAEVLACVSGTPDWFALRRTIEILCRLLSANRKDRAGLAHKLRIPKRDIDDVYSCCSEPGHDRTYPQHRTRDYTLQQATRFVRDLAHRGIPVYLHGRQP